MRKVNGALCALCIMLSFNASAGYNEELRCMTVNAYHEARGESKMGLLMVMDTVMERKASVRFPNTVCGVVHQKNQFSWTRNPQRITQWRTYNKIKKLAIEVLAGKWKGLSGGSVFYHARRIKPFWSKSFTVTKTIDNHVFYRY